MNDFAEEFFEQVGEKLCLLSDKQLTNLIEVIRAEQAERESDKMAASVGR